MNGLQSLPQWRSTFGKPEGALLGFMNAVYPLSKVIGLFPATWLGDNYGRRRPMFVGFLLLPIGAALQAAAQNTPMFIASRFVLGFSTSFLAQPSPILVTELAYPTQRAKITSLYNTFFVSLVIPMYFVRLLLTMLVSRSGASSLVNFRNIQDSINLGMAHPIASPSSYAVNPIRILLLASRVSKVCHSSERLETFP